MAFNIYVQLTAGGSAITGNVSATALGGVDVSSDHIEAHALFHEVSFSGGTDAVRTRATPAFGPLVFTKRIDRATPLLFRAWAQNQVIDAVVKLFYPHPETGESTLWQVIHVWQGRVSAIRTEMLNNLTPEGAPMPVLERVTLVYQNILVSSIPFSTEWSNT